MWFPSPPYVAPTFLFRCHLFPQIISKKTFSPFYFWLSFPNWRCVLCSHLTRCTPFQCRCSICDAATGWSSKKRLRFCSLSMRVRIFKFKPNPLPHTVLCCTSKLVKKDLGVVVSVSEFEFWSLNPLPHTFLCCTSKSESRADVFLLIMMSFGPNALRGVCNLDWVLFGRILKYPHWWISFDWVLCCCMHLLRSETIWVGVTGRNKLVDSNNGLTNLEFELHWMNVFGRGTLPSDKFVWSRVLSLTLLMDETLVECSISLIKRSLWVR
jgi:hypothetical protein